jgi:hypothetical protein
MNTAHSYSNKNDGSKIRRLLNYFPNDILPSSFLHAFKDVNLIFLGIVTIMSAWQLGTNV